MKLFDFDDTIKIDTQFTVFGIPWDYLTSIELPNSSIAPDEIRRASSNIGLITELGFNVFKLKVIDVGDVPIEKMNVAKNLENIKNFILELFNKNKKIIPVMIGGDHFCSYPVIKTIGDQFENKEEFGVLIFDAHLDLYQQWIDNVYSHATLSHRVYDLDYINNRNFLIVGTRDIDIPELKIADSEEIKHVASHLLIEGLENYTQRIINFYKNSNIKHLYVSIDIDSIDPSNAPGTGYAIPGGFTYREIWKILRALAKNFNILAFDLVEVAPNLDLENRMTCNLAAKLIVEFISFINDSIQK